MNIYNLITSVVPHECGEFISDAAKTAGANGGSIIMGRGTAENSILQLLGLGDTSKDIVYIICEDDKKFAILEAIITASNEKKAHFGVLFTMELGNFMKAGNVENSTNVEKSTEKDEKNNYQTEKLTQNKSKGESSMENSHQMINVIVNKGYAEDAMAAARKAGARGGTIISARGTAKENDAAFFGMKIVPEKDMLIILSPTEQKEAIVKAITDLPCFDEVGSGIIFCNDVKDFTLLGKKNS